MTGGSAVRLIAGLMLASLMIATRSVPVTANDVSTAKDAFDLQRRIGDDSDPQRPESLRTVAVSPDGRFVALAGEPSTPTINNTVQLRECATGKLLQTLRGHETVVRALAFSSDDGQIVTLTSDSTGTGSVRFFDVESGRLVRTVDAGGTRIRLLPDRTFVAAGYGRAYVYEITGRELARRDAPSVVKHLSPDGRFLVGVSHHGSRTLDVRELEHGTTIVSLAGCTREPVAAVFSPEGRTIAAADPKTRSILLWEVLTGQLIQTLEADQVVTALAFTADGRYLLGGDAAGTLQAWEVATGSDAGRIEAHQGAITALAVGPEHTILTGSTDRTAGLWSIENLTHSTLPAGTPDAATLDEAWDSLAGSDATAAGRSLGLIARHAEAAMPAMQSHVERQLRPISESERERLLAELDDPDYLVRERATAALARAGDRVRRHLQQRLAETSSPEVAARLRELLRRAGRSPRLSTGDLLRLRRLIGVAERIGGRASQNLLRLIAADTATPTIAEEARQSLERIDD